MRVGLNLSGGVLIAQDRIYEKGAPDQDKPICCSL